MTRRARRAQPAEDSPRQAVTPEPPPLREPPVLIRFWPNLSGPFATEIGAIVALAVAAIPGMAAAILALVLLELILPRIQPPEEVVRAAILVAGPPLRYLLVAVAAWRAWTSPTEGLVQALSLVLVLVFAVPLASFLVAQGRAHRP